MRAQDFLNFIRCLLGAILLTLLAAASIAGPVYVERVDANGIPVVDGHGNPMAEIDHWKSFKLDWFADLLLLVSLLLFLYSLFFAYRALFGVSTVNVRVE